MKGDNKEKNDKRRKRITKRGKIRAIMCKRLTKGGRK